MHKGTITSPLLSLSTVSIWLQRLSLCPLISSSLLLSLLSCHWPLSLFLLIPQLSPFSYSHLPLSGRSLWLLVHLWGPVSSAPSSFSFTHPPSAHIIFLFFMLLLPHNIFLYLYIRFPVTGKLYFCKLILSHTCFRHRVKSLCVAWYWYHRTLFGFPVCSLQFCCFCFSCSHFDFPLSYESLSISHLS